MDNFKFPNGAWIDQETFEKIFEGVEWTYGDLMEKGEQLGYKPLFDKWLEEGKLQQ